VIASGGIKSNQNVFGSIQFHLPNEEKQLNTYLSMQYFASKSGVLIGQIVMPILRHDVKCMGMDDCFPLAFGFSTSLLLLGSFVFMCGRSHYVQVKPTGNAYENGLVKVFGCCVVSNCSDFSGKRF
jgi:dipeptide/tripeptide permease